MRSATSKRIKLMPKFQIKSLRIKIGVWTGLCLVLAVAGIMVNAIVAARNSANESAKQYAVSEARVVAIINNEQSQS